MLLRDLDVCLPKLMHQRVLIHFLQETAPQSIADPHRGTDHLSGDFIEPSITCVHLRSSAVAFRVLSPSPIIGVHRRSSAVAYSVAFTFPNYLRLSAVAVAFIFPG